MSLGEIIKNLKAPKAQFNDFGKYAYRSCEDILEAVKPLLGDCSLLLTDEIIMLGGRYYVKATARFTEGDRVVEVYAYAREEDVKKGMDASQITGSASSYARKYALNGLFLIDDANDSDGSGKQKKQRGEAGAATTNPDVIDANDIVGLRKIAAKAKYSNDLMKQILAACGYESSKSIKRKHYQTICEFIEGTPIEKAVAGIDHLAKWCKEN